MVKRLSKMQEILIPSLGWKDPLEKEMADHSSTLAWKISCMQEPGRLQSMGGRKKSMTEHFTFTFTFFDRFTFKVIINIYVPIAIF